MSVPYEFDMETITLSDFPDADIIYVVRERKEETENIEQEKESDVSLALPEEDSASEDDLYQEGFFGSKQETTEEAETDKQKEEAKQLIASAKQLIAAIKAKQS